MPYRSKMSQTECRNETGSETAEKIVELSKDLRPMTLNTSPYAFFKVVAGVLTRGAARSPYSPPAEGETY